MSDETIKIIIGSVATLICSTLLLIVQRFLERYNLKKQRCMDIYNASVDADVFYTPALEMIISCALNNLHLFEQLINNPIVKKELDGSSSWSLSISQPKQFAISDSSFHDILPIILRAEYFVLQDDVYNLNLAMTDFYAYYCRITNLIYGSDGTNHLANNDNLSNNIQHDIEKISKKIITAHCRLLLQVMRIQATMSLSSEHLVKLYGKLPKTLSYKTMKQMVSTLTEYKADRKDIQKKINEHMAKLNTHASENTMSIIEELLRDEDPTTN